MNDCCKETLTTTYHKLVRKLVEYKFLRGIDYIDTVVPTHGNCCTCQDCGHGHDECVCEQNELLRLIELAFDV